MDFKHAKKWTFYHIEGIGLVSQTHLILERSFEKHLVVLAQEETFGIEHMLCKKVEYFKNTRIN
jgi:hypothetical protein